MPSNLQLLPKFKEKLSYLYIEHAVIEKVSQSIVIFNKTDAETSVTQVPVCDLALLMLGPGTKISHAAIDVISRNNCLILWTGEKRPTRVGMNRTKLARTHRRTETPHTRGDESWEMSLAAEGQVDAPHAWG